MLAVASPPPISYLRSNTNTLAPALARYAPASNPLGPPPIIITSYFLSMAFPPYFLKLQQPQFPGASYLLRLFPPLAYAQILGYRVGRQISGTKYHRTPRIGATGAPKKILYRRSVV